MADKGGAAAIQRNRYILGAYGRNFGLFCPFGWRGVTENVGVSPTRPPSRRRIGRPPGRLRPNQDFNIYCNARAGFYSVASFSVSLPRNDRNQYAMAHKLAKSPQSKNGQKQHRTRTDKRNHCHGKKKRRRTRPKNPKTNETAAIAERSVGPPRQALCFRRWLSAPNGSVSLSVFGRFQRQVAAVSCVSGIGVLVLVVAR